MKIISHTHRTQRHWAQQGAALFLVLALLALLSYLGTIYLKNMTIEFNAADMIVQDARAEAMAEAGINIAIGQLQKALDDGDVGALLSGEPVEYDEFPVFRKQRADDKFLLANVGEDAEQLRKLTASVIIEDECAKLNLNHTPASVLSCLVGDDRETARKITSSLPTSVGGSSKGWLMNPSDLLSRKLLSKAQYAGIDPVLMTTDSVVDHANPAGFLNLNTVPPNLLAAILALTPEEAVVVAKTNYTAYADLVAATSKDPGTFNIKPDPLNPTAMPKAFTLRSRLYRIKSTGMYSKLGNTEASQFDRTAYAEALVQLNTDGSYEILRWTTQRGTE